MTEIQILLANWMSALALLLPFGYSFGAGMVSTVNPCGFSCCRRIYLFIWVAGMRALLPATLYAGVAKRCLSEQR